MWYKIAQIILKYRLYWLITVLLITVLMAYQVTKIEWSYNFSNTVPSYEEEQIYFQAFKKKYGEDGNILAVGLQNELVFQLKNFQELQKLSDKLLEVEGVNDVLSLPNMQYLVKDTANKKFSNQAVFPDNITSQKELDSLLVFAQSLKFYENQLLNPQTRATVLLLSIDKNALNSKRRQKVIRDILAQGDAFEKASQITLHYAGLPVVRSIMTDKMATDLMYLLGFSLLGMAIVLFAFFRAFRSVIFPMIVIAILITWTVGTIVLFGYKINILSGLLPPILVVIGIPNCVYLLNKYHQEYKKTGDKMRSLTQVVRRIGVVALMTNTTTAIGFFVFTFMDIRILREFGLLATVNIINTFIVSILLVPIFFSYLPDPKPRELRHLDKDALRWVLAFLHKSVFQYRRIVYLIALIIIPIAIYGFYRVEVVSYMVDDIPEDSRTRKDLAFFEKNFGGVMPLEVVINTGKLKGVTRLPNLRKIGKFEDTLRTLEFVSPPVSLVSFIKASRQAYYNNADDFYDLPSSQDKNFVLRYLKNSEGNEQNEDLLNAFVDSLGREMRVSLSVADVGSIKMDSLIDEVIRPIIDDTFFPEEDEFTAEQAIEDYEDALADFIYDEQFSVHVTGTTLLFVKGNRYLVDNLKSSLLIAIVLISILMAILFRSFRMIFISILTNILPLLITAGIMGYFGVPLKPSTALIFSIAFGIAVDDSIHYLARYRQGLASGLSVKEAVSISLKETGTAMIYTSLILFAGFIIFVTSEFDGTNALGLLTATTLIFAMLANLVLLPGLLITFDKRKTKSTNNEDPSWESEFYDEEDDKELNIDSIQVKKE